MEPRDRIRQTYEELELSQRRFAVTIGLTPSGLSAVMVGRNNVSPTLANSIELKHGYRAEWILTGEGEKYAYSKSFLGLLEAIKKITTDFLIVIKELEGR